MTTFQVTKDRLLMVSLQNEKVLSRAGAMVAYEGKIKFSKAILGGEGETGSGGSVRSTDERWPPSALFWWWNANCRPGLRYVPRSGSATRWFPNCRSSPNGWRAL